MKQIPCRYISLHTHTASSFTVEDSAATACIAYNAVDINHKIGFMTLQQDDIEMDWFLYCIHAKRKTQEWKLKSIWNLFYLLLAYGALSAQWQCSIFFFFSFFRLLLHVKGFAVGRRWVASTNFVVIKIFVLDK